MPLFIHMGLHKTGTTSIQTFMSMNADLLARHGLIYPADGRGKHAHHAIAYELRGDPERPRKRQGLKEVAEFARANPDINILISSEGLENLQTSQVERLRDTLSDIEVVILMYIRPYADALPSKYSQQVKNGSVLENFDKFLRKLLRSRDGKYRGRFVFLRSADRWADVFGWKAMEIRVLDRSCMVGGDLITDLLSIFGLSYKDLEPEFAPGSIDRHNPSVGWKSLELLRALQVAAFNPRNRENSKVAAKESGIEKTGKRLRRAALIAADKISLPDERGRYLTREQFDKCNKLYDADVEEANTHLVRTKIGSRSPANFTAREFLPIAAEVPELERLRFNEAVLYELMRMMSVGLKFTSKDFSEKDNEEEEEIEEDDDE